MLQSDPDLKNKVINLDLHKYLGELEIAIIGIKVAKEEFCKWWNCETSQASELSRDCRNTYKVRDDVIRNSLKYSIIIQLYSILKDNQSKCFDKVYPEFRKTSHQKVIEGIFKPLWDEFVNHHKAEIDRLIINRNNYFAHLSKRQPVNEILEQGNFGGEKVERKKEYKFWLIEYDDICNQMSIFSKERLNYLMNLLKILDFSNIPDEGIYDSIACNIEKHLSDFRKRNELKWPAANTI